MARFSGGMSVRMWLLRVMCFFLERVMNPR
jgi:hypothetical protein